MPEEKAYKINHIAVIVLVVLHQILPAIWYAIFADGWMLVWDKTLEDVANPSSLPYIYSVVGSVIMNYTIAWLYMRMNIQTVASGVKVALVLWLAFVFHAFLIHHAFTLIPFEATIYDAGIELINMAIAGVLLVVWRRR